MKAKIQMLYVQVSSKHSFSLVPCFRKNQRRLLCAEGEKAVLPVLPQCLPLATRSLVGTDSFCSRLQMNKIDLPNMKSKHTNILICDFFLLFVVSDHVANIVRNICFGNCFRKDLLTFSQLHGKPFRFRNNLI